MRSLNRTSLIGLLFLVAYAASASAISLPDNDVLMRALVDELDRSMKNLKLEDLPRPYFIQYRADDRLTYNVSAAYGGLVRSAEDRSRRVTTRIRVGSYEYDNSNYGRPFGGAGILPVDDDYTALRHAIWFASDRDYKSAVEVLALKLAYLKTKEKDEERADDYTPAEPAVLVEPSPELEFDLKEWEQRAKALSARFAKFAEVQESAVNLNAGVVARYIVNTEGTRLRLADTGIILTVSAELQAADGMRLGDSVIFLGERVSDLPSMDEMLARIDKLCTDLVAASKGEVLEHYTGPVLFEPEAAGVMFETLLADGFAARPVPVGGRGGAETSMERKLGLRILPRTFTIVDDAGPTKFDNKLLIGSYRADDEGVKPQRVTLVEKGILKSLLVGRAPTKKVRGTTGHARSEGFTDPVASASCLYFTDEAGVAADELRREFLQAVQEEGMAFGIRVVSLEGGAGETLGDPILAYKVFPDGKEEPIRGVEFLPVQVRALKRLAAAGTERKVHNSMGSVGRSVIAPAVLFDELELTKIDRELDKLPILKSPATR